MTGVRFLQCKPVSYGPPVVDSVRASCSRCGVPVWFDPDILAGLDAVPELVCPGCVPADAVHALTDGQVARLRSMGLSDQTIAGTVALATLAHDVTRAAEVAAEIQADPTGPLADRYRRVTADTVAELARIDR